MSCGELEPVEVEPDEPEPEESVDVSVELDEPDPEESVESVEPDEPEPDESLIGSGKAATASLRPPLALAWVATSAWLVNSSVVISLVTNCFASVVLFATISLIALAVVADVSTVTPPVAT